MSADLRDIVTRETRKRERESVKSVCPQSAHTKWLFFMVLKTAFYIIIILFFLNMNTAFASSFCRRHLYLCVYVPAKERETKKEWVKFLSKYRFLRFSLRYLLQKHNTALQYTESHKSKTKKQPHTYTLIYIYLQYTLIRNSHTRSTTKKKTTKKHTYSMPHCIYLVF